MAATATQSLSIEAQGNLRRQGYRLETSFGWDTHEIPLYVHAPGKIRPVGEIGFKMRVGNLKNLDAAEASYLARKGTQGFFTWEPAECMEHEFTSVEIKRRPGGGVVAEKSKNRVFGCKWCRAAKPSGLQGEAESAEMLAVESTDQPDDSAPPAITTESTGSGSGGVACTLCGVVMSDTSKSGKPRSTKQQLHALKLHTNRKHAT